MPSIIIPKIKEAKVKIQGINVILLIDGEKIAELHWEVALLISRALNIQARKIEENLKAEKIAYDQATLLRAGINLGLTNNKAIQDEAKKLAAHDQKLRKYIPHTTDEIRSREVVGAPTIIKHRRRNDA